MTTKRKLRRQRNRAVLRVAQLEEIFNAAPAFETLEVEWPTRRITWRGHTINASHEHPVTAMPILLRDRP